MRPWLGLAFATAALAGCAGASDDEAGTTEPARVRDPELLSITVEFHGDDQPRVCPPPSCPVAAVTAVFESILDADTRLNGLRIFLGWDDRTFDPVGTFRFTADCARNGDHGCPEDIRIAEADGPMPLTLEVHQLGLPAGARIVFTVTSDDVMPGVAGTGQPYTINGVLVALRDRGTA